MNNYRMIKLKIKDFEKEILYKDKEKTEPLTYEDKTIKALYKNDLNKKIENKMNNINRFELVAKITKKINKSNKLNNEQKNKEIIKKVDETLEEIRLKIIRNMEDRVIVRETELIRIIRTLNLKDNNIDDNGYIKINDLISVNISTPIYKTIQDGIIEFNKEKFIRLLASSGNLRNKKVIFIKLDLYDKAMDILLCGLPKNLQHKKISKYNAYMGLPNSDTQIVTTPRIIVIKDYENEIKEKYNVVTKKLNGKFKFEPNKDDIAKNMPFDGAGLCSLEIAEQWSRDLGLINRYKTWKTAPKNIKVIPSNIKVKSTNINGEKLSKIKFIPSSFQFRAIVGIKGNLYTMDIKKYLSELPKDKRYITDAWGKSHKVMDDEDNLLIDAILTESQFKFKDYYDNLEEWEKAFKTDLHGYHRTFNIAKWGNQKNKEKALLSYQPIQSLELTDDEIKELCKPTLEIIDKISNNVDDFLKYRGLLQEKRNELGEIILVDSDMDRVPPYYQALRKDKSLFKDAYIQKKVQADIKNFKENASKGMVFIEGQYQTLTIDLVGFMEFATGQEIKGAVPPNQVYGKYWMGKEITSNGIDDNGEVIEVKEKVTELDLIRFPAIAQEHCLVSVIQEENEWFKYIDDGIIVSMFDSNLLKLGNADSDGDRVLNTPSKVIRNAVRRQESNCILFKEEKKKEKKTKEPTEPKNNTIAINNIKELIACDCRGMDASIGEVVNKTTILWSMPKDKKGKRDEYINVISVVGALVIDFVKTGVKEDVPDNIIKYIKKVHKPKFLKVKYKDLEHREKRTNKNMELIAKDDKDLKKKKVELFSNTKCTMNKLYDYINIELKNIKSKFPEKVFDWTRLLKYKKLNIDNDTYPLVAKKITELKEEHDILTQKFSIDSDTYEYDSDRQMEKVDQYKYYYKYCRSELINLNKETKKKDKLLDYAIYVFYADEDFTSKHDDKSLLWNVFGNELNIRFENKEFKEPKFRVCKDEDKLNLQKENLSRNVDKSKNKALKVNIKGIDDIEKNGKQEVNFSRERIEKEIDKLELSRDSKKVLMVLVMLDELFKEYKKELIIEQAKRGTLNRNVISKLTRLNIINVETALSELNKDNEYIHLTTPKNNKEKLECKIKFEYENKGNTVILRDSESIYKNMRKTTFQK